MSKFMKYFFIGIAFCSALIFLVSLNFEKKEKNLNVNSEDFSAFSKVVVSKEINENNSSTENDSRYTVNDDSKLLLVKNSSPSIDRLVSLKVREYLDMNDVDSVISAILSGSINYQQVSRKEKIELSKLLTKKSDEEQFEKLIVMDVIKLDEPEMYQDEIIDTYSDTSSEAEEVMALNKFRVLEKYGADISQLHRTVEVNGATEQFGPLERAISTGMPSLVDYFFERAVEFRSSEMAWGGLVITKKGDYVETARKLIDYGYGPDLNFVKKVLNKNYLADDDKLRVLFEKYALENG